jgi:two-component system OmpR family response regulator
MKYLAVDSDIDVANREALVWEKRAIGMERVDNMTDGIKKLMINEYLFFGINGGVIDFMPLLRTMSRATSSPIFIVTDNFSTQTEVNALENGADLYSRWHESTEDNILSVLANLSRKSERKASPRKVIIHGNLLLSPVQRSVYIKDREIELTRREFDLLHYFMINIEIVLSSESLYSHVWKNQCPEQADAVIKSAIKRLRKKITGTDEEGYIETIREVGFKFSVKND